MPPSAPLQSALPLAVTMGDPAGIGGDVTLAAWTQRRAADLPLFFVIDDPDRLTSLSNQLGLHVPVTVISTPADAPAVFPSSLPVLPVPLKSPAIPGQLNKRNAPCVIEALIRAVELAKGGEVAGIVTNPIHKETLYASGFAHPGHTEFLAAATNGVPVMMLSCPGLRVVPVTIHVPLNEVAALLTHDLIVSRGKILARALAQDFGIPHPRIAVAALNPHAGEGGAFGTEEADIIAPAVATLRASGIEVSGPSPADTLFHGEARGRYDAVLAMYHDQALIPLKTIDFDRGVNTTLGLPIVRTSPDHGTACSIAGTGKANPASLIAALHQAATIAAYRSPVS